MNQDDHNDAADNQQDRAVDHDILVMKFGGSVLREESRLEAIALEIYREVAQGRKVVAVVSALYGETDRLVKRARNMGVDVDTDDVTGLSRVGASGQVGLASLLASGETVSASLLGVALDTVGLSIELFDARKSGMVGSGPQLDAKPERLDVEAFRSAFDHADVVVLPGFGLLDEAGAPMLLGRGGTDLSAVFVADQLGGDLVLIKDVDGLYEHDPAEEGKRPPRKYASVSFDDAPSFGTKVLQPKALDWATNAGVQFALRALESRSGGTSVGHVQTKLLEKPEVAAPKVRIAIAGLGTVGGGVATQLLKDPSVEIVSALVKDLSKERPVSQDRLVQSPQALLDSNPDVLIEVMGGDIAEVGGARWLIREALDRGIHVVTANKAAIAADLAEDHGSLLRLAEKRGVELRYSAAVGGGAPIIERVDMNSPSENVLVQGVVNGTCNFIIGQMGRGVSYDDAVKAAQIAGFAEADPSLDVDGSDAAQKLAILVWHAFGEALDWRQIERQGVEGLDPAEVLDANRAGDRIRVIAVGVRTPELFACSVRPERVPADSPLGRLEDEWNGVLIRQSDGSERRVTGKGAGRWPTAHAVLNDIGDVLHAVRSPQRA